MALALEHGGVSVNEMAAHLGISRTTVSNYLHGRTKPRRGDLIAWAMRCGVPFEWLVNGDDEAIAAEKPKKATKKAATTPPKPVSRTRRAAGNG